MAAEEEESPRVEVAAAASALTADEEQEQLVDDALHLAQLRARGAWDGTSDVVKCWASAYVSVLSELGYSCHPSVNGVAREPGRKQVRTCSAGSQAPGGAHG